MSVPHSQFPFEGIGDGILLSVFAKPRAARTRVAGIRKEGQRSALAIALAAPPVGGAANEELRRFVARQLRIPRSSVVLVSGETGRHKVLRLQGLPRERVEAWLEPHLEP